MSPAWRTALLWLVPALVLLLAFVLLRGILLPFLVGMAVAYILDPVADRLQRLGLGRGTATLTLTILFFAGLVPLVVLTCPWSSTKWRTWQPGCRAISRSCAAPSSGWRSG